MDVCIRERHIYICVCVCLFVRCLPEVGSIKQSPGLIRPDFSASSIIRLPIRSLTEPPALKNSHLATRRNKIKKKKKRKRSKEKKMKIAQY